MRHKMAEKDAPVEIPPTPNANSPANTQSETKSLEQPSERREEGKTFVLSCSLHSMLV